MVILLYDPKTGERIYCFWNPRARRRYCFSFAFVDRLFRITTFVRRLWICSTATFESHEDTRHISKNIYLESQCCSYIDFEEYGFIRFDVEFMRKLEEIADKLDACHHKCEQKFMDAIKLEKVIPEIPENIKTLPFLFEIAGVEFTRVEGKTYCCFTRIPEKGAGLEGGEKCKCIKIVMVNLAPSVVLPNCREAP